MGTQLLTLALVGLLLLAGCAAPEGDGHAHADLACGRCHSGALAAKGLAAVPSASCAAAGCHPDGGPRAARLALVQFAHRGHGSDAQTPPTCAGCHAHSAGDEPLRPSLDSCVLCHHEDIFDPVQRDCRMCHGRAVHEELASQGVPIPHGGPQLMGEECMRCHFDVGEAKVEVDLASCLECHRDADRVLREGAGRELHPSHDGFGCQRCHGETRHRVRAMSSAVEMDCDRCHGGVHLGDETILAEELAQGCSSCHAGSHIQQQQLLLGRVGESRAPTGRKFLAGLSCGSCHAGEPGAAGACRDCHDASYARVLAWWQEGLDQRARLVRHDVDRAYAALGDAGRTVPAPVARADSLLRIVELGGGSHNLELSDWIFHRSVELVGEAWLKAGRFRPPAPELGNRARWGFCSHCHYDEVPAWTGDLREVEGHARFLGPR